MFSGFRSRWDPLLVRGGQAVRDLQRVTDRLARRKGSSGEPGTQRFAFEKLRDEIGRSIVSPDVMDGQDVGVIQNPGGAGLLLEPPQPVRISREGSGKNLDRHLAPQPRVPRAIHLSHAARAERREDLVGAEAGTCSECHLNPLSFASSSLRDLVPICP